MSDPIPNAQRASDSVQPLVGWWHRKSDGACIQVTSCRDGRVSWRYGMDGTSGMVDAHTFMSEHTLHPFTANARLDRPEGAKETP